MNLASIARKMLYVLRHCPSAEDRIKELQTACEAVAHALLNNDMAGVCVWILPPYQVAGVHESAWERLDAVLHPIPQPQGSPPR